MYKPNRSFSHEKAFYFCLDDGIPLYDSRC